MKDDDAITAHEFLQEIYRNEEVALPVRMRAAIESLPFEKPKLASTTNVHFDASFGALLDRAIERSQRPMKLISPPEHPPEEIKGGPMPRLRRRI